MPDPFPTALTDIATYVWHQLGAAVSRQEHGFHWPVVATIDEGGDPQARVVVLRRAASDEGVLAFHTDRRSPKVAQVNRHPRLAITFHDGPSKLQVRATGSAVVELAGERADLAWSGIGPGSKKCYLAPSPPSLESDRSTHNLPEHLTGRVPEPAEVVGGRVNFAVVTCLVEEFDVLRLDYRGHVRARFTLDRGVVTGAAWLQP